METTDYVSYDLALALKKCGFDEPCYSKWAVEPDGKPFLMGSCLAGFISSECKGRDVLAPFIWQAQKWLREKYGIHIDAYPYADTATDADGRVCDEWHYWGADLIQVVTGERISMPADNCDSYEQALSAGISAALELIKEGV